MINLKTAKALGLTIPPSVLAIADEVIEQDAFAPHESGYGTDLPLRPVAGVSGFRGAADALAARGRGC